MFNSRLLGEFKNISLDISNIPIMIISPTDTYLSLSMVIHLISYLSRMGFGWLHYLPPMDSVPSWDLLHFGQSVFQGLKWCCTFNAFSDFPKRAFPLVVFHRLIQQIVWSFCLLVCPAHLNLFDYLIIYSELCKLLLSFICSGVVYRSAEVFVWPI